MSAKLKLVTAAAPKKARVARKAPARKGLSRLTLTGLSLVGAISTTALAVSMGHLAHGVSLMSTSTPTEGWAMAVVIDASLMAAKLVPYICESDEQRALVQSYAKPLALATLAMTVYLNTLGFAGEHTPLMSLRMLGCFALGLTNPGSIFALNQIAAILAFKRKG